MSLEECTDLLVWYQRTVQQRADQIKNLQQQVQALTAQLQAKQHPEPLNPHSDCDWDCDCRLRPPG